ncbi:MAG: hypothetical protein PGN08_05555 [Sphingomonas taxi]
MSLLAALLLQVSVVAPPPLDTWTDLPELRLRDPIPATPELSEFVRQEVVAGRCAAARVDGTRQAIDLDLAVFADHAAGIRRVVPRGIGCPTVEQYAAGLLLRLARGNLAPAAANVEGWYRTTLRFAWKE